MMMMMMTMKKMGVIVTLLCFLLYSCSATLYEPKTNLGSNRDKEWAFGSYSSSNPVVVASFSRFPYSASYSQSGGLFAWVSTPSFGYPCVFYNPSNTSSTTNSIPFAPNQIGCHPGSDGTRSGIRFTAPEETCKVYEIKYAFWGRETSTKSDVAISYKGQNLMSSAITYSASAPATQMKCLLMQKNDVLDVTVGYGSDNSYTSDTTSVTLSINSTCFETCSQYTCTMNNQCNGRGTCNGDGTCNCSPTFTSSSNCIQCSANYYPTNSCNKYCSANTTCSGHGSCDASGNCVCSSPWAGPNCNNCIANVYPDGVCNKYCDADTMCGGIGVCNASGLCECPSSFPSGTCIPATPQTNLVTNANPEWRFGYFTPQTTPTNAAGFVPFNHYGPYDVNLFAWSRSDNYPLVGFNTAFKTLNAMPMNIPFVPQRHMFHPGSAGERSAVRFIATQPVCKVYQMYYAFWGMESGGTSDVSITYKGAVIYNQPSITYTTVVPKVSSPFCMKMEVNETIDISVGMGGDDYYADVVGIKLFVEAICVPSCAAVPCLLSKSCIHGNCNETGQCECDVGWTGVNCNVCADDYYPAGSCTTYCNANTTCNGYGECNALGQCVCDSLHQGSSSCNKCSANRYNYPTCSYCLANTTCSGYGTCNDLGTCDCRASHNGSASCNLCGTNRFNYPTCNYCEESETCHSKGECTATGQCNCTTGYSGDFCDGCQANYTNYPVCTYCTRAETCSGHGSCNSTGQCECDYGFSGSSCNDCSADHYSYPTCTHCTRESTCGGRGSCTETGGCECDDGFDGIYCGGCGPNSYSFPDCIYCTRAENCTSNGNCALNGSCSCDGGFDGTGCGECATNYYAYPACKFCTRNNTCHTHGNCSAAGTCNCDDGFDVNFSCGRCSADHYNYPNCVACTRNDTCGGNGKCNELGKCDCDSGFTGDACDMCADDYYAYPSCRYCTERTCNGHGNCTTDGFCSCENSFAGDHCNDCSAERFDYPNCVYCNTTVTCSGHGSCNSLGQCDCEDKFDGSSSCNQCSTSHYNYPACDYCTRNDTCNGFGKCVDANEICECDAGYNSTDCGSCDFDHYNYPSCTYCEASLNCSGYGSCNATGQCDCFTTHNGNSSCDKCSVDHYDFPYCRFCSSNTTCNGKGTCNETGLCECDELYSGVGCTECKDPGLMYPACIGSTTSSTATTTSDSTDSTTSSTTATDSTTSSITSSTTDSTASVTTTTDSTISSTTTGSYSTTSSTSSSTTDSTTSSTSSSTAASTSSTISSTTAGSTTSSTTGNVCNDVPSSPLLSSSITTRTSILILWQAPDSCPIISYTLQQATSTFVWATVYQGSQSQINVTGLTAGTTYYFRIAAANNAGSSIYSSPINDTTNPLSVPSQAHSLSMVENLRDAIEVKWIAAADDGGSPITHHLLQYSIDSLLWNNISILSTATTFLKARQQYFIRVASGNIVGLGPVSEISFFSTLDESCGDGICDNETYYSEDCSSCPSDCEVCSYPVCPGTTECDGNGLCVKGNCNCQKGWTGPSCSIPDSSSVPVEVVVNNTAPVIEINGQSISFGLSFSDIQEVNTDGNIFLIYYI